MERRHIDVKLPILGEINKEAGSPIGRAVNTRNSSTY